MATWKRRWSSRFSVRSPSRAVIWAGMSRQEMIVSCGPDGRRRGAGRWSAEDVAASGMDGVAPLLDQRPGRLRGDRRVAAVGVRTHRHAELLVERRTTHEHDVVVAQAAALQL